MDIGTAFAFAFAGIVIAAAATYLILRNNPGKRAKLDAVTDAAEAKAKDAAAKAKLKIEELRR